MPDRVFTVYGTASADAEVALWQNDQLMYSKPLDHQNTDPFDKNKIAIYQFATDVKAHGWTKIKLEILQGQVQTHRTKMRYPAVHLRNWDIKGWFWFYQPIDDPKFLVSIDNNLIINKSDGKNIGEQPYDLVKDQTMDYYHLAYNGPVFWVVDVPAHDIQSFQTTGIFSPNPYCAKARMTYEFAPTNEIELERIKNHAIIHRQGEITIDRKIG